MREFKSYTCPLCGEISKQPKKHWKSKHRYEITWVEFMKLIQGKSYCLECGKELEPKVVDRVPKFCDYSCELKYRNKHGIGVKSRECPLCGKSFRGLWEHWETNHKDEVSWEMFLALLQGLDEIPRCKYCGEQAEYSWSNKCYKQTCGSEECERKLALEQGCKLHSTYYGDATLYLIGFYDTRTKKFCVKCGMSYFLNHRLSFFKNVGYILKRGFKWDSTSDKVLEIESMVHTHGFARYQMDWRISGGTTNGPTEWYQQSEFSKIYHYLTDELGLVLTEIKQD